MTLLPQPDGAGVAPASRALRELGSVEAEQGVRE
jgi:hypothetical protein